MGGSGLPPSSPHRARPLTRAPYSLTDTVLVLVVVHMLEREWSPMIDPFAANFSHGLSWWVNFRSSLQISPSSPHVRPPTFRHSRIRQIVMMVIYMLFLDAGVVSGADAVWYSVGLFAFNVGLMLMLIKAAVEGIKKLKKLYEHLKVLNEQLRKDKHEDKQKFTKVRGWADASH